jgi:sugar lactone lactonase YvrE
MNQKLSRRGQILGFILLLAGTASAQSLVVSTMSLTGASPAGVAVGADGNCYFAVPAVSVIWKMSPTGVIQVLAGQVGVSGSTDGPAASALFVQPTGIAVDISGNVYVADPGNSTIRMITPAGMVSTLAGIPGVLGSHDGPGSSATFQLPDAIAVDATQNVYVADGQNMSIRKIDTTGNVSTLATINEGLGYSLQGISMDSAGDIFVSSGTFAGGYATFQAPPAANVIYKRSAAGAVSLFVGQLFVTGSSDGPGAQASFNNPAGLAMDAAGNVFVADSGNRILREITPAGVVTTVAGTAGFAGVVDGSGNTSRFQAPWGLAIDAYGNVFATDGQAVRRGIPEVNTESPTRFVDLSARAMVTPTSPLIGGFVVEGTVAQTVLARGVGPTLSQFAVSNPLQSPQLDIYGQNGALVASSIAGTNAINSGSAGKLAGAFSLPVGAGDVAVVITLKPGAYTAVVSSPGGGSGTALVEVYEIP